MAKKAKKKHRGVDRDRDPGAEIFSQKKTAAAKIGKKLKRTKSATRQKAFSIGLSLDTRETEGTGPRRHKR